MFGIKQQRVHYLLKVMHLLITFETSFALSDPTDRVIFYA